MRLPWISLTNSFVENEVVTDNANMNVLQLSIETSLCNLPGETQPGGLFSQPGEILANLGPGQFLKKALFKF